MKQKKQSNNMRLFLKIVITVLVLIAVPLFAPKDKAEASIGKTQIRVFTTVDGQQVRLPGVTVLYISKISNELWGTPYHYRSGPNIKHGYLVTNSNGFTALDSVTSGTQDGVWYDNCSAFGSMQQWGLMIYGGSQRGTIIGGVPNLLSDELGLAGEGECTNAICADGNWNREDGSGGLYACDYPWGYMSALQCITAYYLQNSNNNGQPPNGEMYRFVPYFPPNYAQAFLANSDNAALRSLNRVFNDEDLKGGGRFVATAWYNPNPDRNALRGDANDITLRGVSSRFPYPNNEVVYQGRSSTPDNSSESLYLATVSNNARVDIQFEWVPGEFQQEECGNEICETGETCDGNVQCSGGGVFTPGECRAPGDVNECTYCGDGVVQGSEECDDGNTNDGDNCNNSCQVPETTTTTTVAPGQPSFDAEKTAGVQCINDSSAAVISYTITVRNTSAVDGTITSVTDTYDSRIQSSWVSNINPVPDSHTGNVIEWNNGGNGFSLPGGGQLLFTYQVTVPSDSFGTVEDNSIPYRYNNVALVRPEGGDDIQLQEEVMITCIATGIFDNAISAVLFASLLIMLGFVAFRYHVEVATVYSRMLTVWPFSEIIDRATTTKQERFERGVLTKARKKKRS